MRLYDTDRKLKLMVLDAIERVEIALRVKIGFTLGRRGAYAHLTPAALDGQFTRGGSRDSRYAAWLAKVATAQTRSSEDFVVHFRSKYDGKLPVWVMTEILDFGSMSHLYQGLKSADRDEIAAGLGVISADDSGNGRALANWLRVLNYVRTVCAHHSRLWNRNLVNQLAPSHLASIPQLARLSERPDAHFRVYSTLCVLAFLLERTHQQSNWVNDVANLLHGQIPLCGRDLRELGFPESWKQDDPWGPR